MPFHIGRATRPALACLAAAAVVIGYSVTAAPAALADTAPADTASPVTPVTVSADGLPTVQINGVVWSQVVVGNTVYAAGSFTKARPAGVPAGQQETVRNNLLAYDIRTGQLITSFAPSLDAQAFAVAASPDGSRIYVGGAFSTANGQARYSIAAYDTATGALVSSFHPVVGADVHALAVTSRAVYVGGDNFSVAGGAARNFLAALDPTTGNALSWAPIADNAVDALAVTPAGNTVVIGGHLSQLNGKPANGLGAVDAVTGASVPFAASTFTTNGGNNSGFTALATDSDTVYATGYSFGSGNLEGLLAINPTGGTVKWVDDCHGDSYSVFATGTSEYIAGHAHMCSNIGGFPQVGGTNQALWTHHRAIAFSKAATGKVGGETGNFAGQPAPSPLTWYPDADEGTYTGQNQGPWSVAGNSSYIVYGGEFPSVNGIMQQGLVRFAVPSIAPNKIGPNPTTGLVPSVTSPAAGTAHVSWQTTWDQDNANLTYDLYRSDRPASPVYETTASSTFWSTPQLGFEDRTAPAGTTVSYHVTARDPYGNTVTGPSTSQAIATAPSSTPDDYATAVLGDGPASYWRLGEASGTTLADLAGTADLKAGTGVTLGGAGALNGRADKSASFDGTANGIAATQSLVSGPNVFSEEAWFATTSTAGGKLIGFGNATSGLSTIYDRHVTMNRSGQLTFGVYNGSANAIVSPSAYNDGRWHHVVATLNPSGMTLYVDGKAAAGRADVTTAQPMSGYWRLGGDATWDGSGPYLRASMDDVAVYSTALTAVQVARHYSLGTGAPVTNTPPTASFTSAASGLSVSVDGSASSDAEGPVAAYAWDFGDGSTGSGKTASHAYAAAGTYTVKLTVTDGSGATGSVTRAVTVSVPVANTPPTASFTSVASGLSVSVDGSASSDAEGPVAAYAWDFGDGSTGSGKTASHAYAAAGTYTVKLTVTDGSGATGSVTHSVTVSVPPAGSALASDAFGRTVTGGWGSADTGGAWTTSGTAANAAVAGGTGALTGAPGATILEDLGISAQDVAVQADVSLDKAPVGGASFVNLAGRNVGGEQYNAQLYFAADGTVELALLSEAGGVETDLGDFTLPAKYTAGTVLRLRLDLAGAGTTTLHAKAWPVTGTEPAWQLTATNTTAALQKAGGLEVQLYQSTRATMTQTLHVDNLWAGASGTVPDGTPAPVNTPPTASFTSVASGLSVSVDGSASSDAEGPVAAYAWDFGDGSTGSGKTASHTYAAAGTYTVKLTVTDGSGATGSVTHSVTVSVPPAGTALASDAFGRTVTGGWGSADTGGAWTILGDSTTASVGSGSGALGATKGTSNLADLGISAQDVAVQADVSLDKAPTGGGSYVNLAGRNVGGQQYNAQLYFGSDGSVELSLLSESGGVETDLGDFTLPAKYTVGSVLRLRLDLAGAGTTTLHAKAWPVAGAEPAAWQLTATNAIAGLQRAGGVEVQLYQSVSATTAQTLHVDNLWAGASGTKP